MHELLCALLSCLGRRCRVGTRPCDSAGADAAAELVLSQYLRDVVVDARHRHSHGDFVRRAAGLALAGTRARQRTLLRYLAEESGVRLEQSASLLAQFFPGARSRVEALRKIAMEAAAPARFARSKVLAARTRRAYGRPGRYLSGDDELDFRVDGAWPRARRSVDGARNSRIFSLRDRRRRHPPHATLRLARVGQLHRHGGARRSRLAARSPRVGKIRGLDFVEAGSRSG